MFPTRLCVLFLTALTSLAAVDLTAPLAGPWHIQAAAQVALPGAELSLDRKSVV